MPDTSPLSNFVTHPVSEPSHWPPELLETTSLLSQPVSKPYRNELSPDAAEMYEEVVRRLPSFSVIQDDGPDTPQKRVTDMLDTLLSIVHALRFLTSTGQRQPTVTRPYWVSLFSALALTCSKDALIKTDVPFLLARTEAVISEDTMLEGRAAMLISSYIGPMSVREDENDADEGFSEGSANTEPRFLPLDGPADGHVLAGPGRRVDCILPVICVANQDNIRALIVSTVYQRYNWGISLPVVGISIENTGVLATVIIGWISEEDQLLGSDLPPVHLASAPETAVESSLGIFDLSDPVSALHFSYFILGLRSQFSDIVTNLGTYRRDICWRQDHVYASKLEDPHSFPSLDWCDRIRKWLEGVDTWDRDPIEPLKLSVVPPAKLIKIIQTYTVKSRSPSPDPESQSSELQTMSDSSATTSYLSDESETESSAPIHYTASAFAAIKDTLDVKSPSESDTSQLELISSDNHPTTRYSPSNFANLEGTLLHSRPGVARWLWERRGLRVGFIKLNELRNLAEIQLNEIINIFTHVLEFAWPDHWPKTVKDVVGIPCNPIHRHLLEFLFAEYQAYSIKQTSPIPALPDDSFSTLSSRLPLFLAALSDAHHRGQQTSGVLKEAKIREPFDLLLNLFWCDEETDVSNLYFQDFSIQFASNKGVEDGLYDRRQAMFCDNMLWNQSMSLPRQDNPALTKAMDKRSKEMTKWKSQTLRFPRPRKIDAAECNFEPTQGVVDGLATTRVRVNSESGSAVVEVLLPRLVVKYQDVNSRHRTNAYRQCQMCCISAVEFLYSIGVVDLPVYGLVVSGSRVSIMMAWHSMKPMKPYFDPKNSSETDGPGFNFLIDENLLSLDIAEPLDAYHFAIVINRICRSGRQLADMLKGKDLETIRKLERQFFCRDT